MAWLISALSVIREELMIRKIWWGWLITIPIQAAWLAFVVTTEQWGLLPLTIYKTLQGCRGARRWYREKEEIANAEKEAHMESSDR